MDAKNQINEWVSEVFPDTDILLADGFEEAFVGIGFQCGNPISIFDYDKCLEILQKDGMSFLDAEEYLEFNVTQAWVGKNTPAFLFKYKPYEISRNTNNQ